MKHLEFPSQPSLGPSGSRPHHSRHRSWSRKSKFSNVHVNVGFFKVSLEFHLGFHSWGVKKHEGGQKNKVGNQKILGPVYFDKISCTCAAQPCTCAAQHYLYTNRAKHIIYIYIVYLNIVVQLLRSMNP